MKNTWTKHSVAALAVGMAADLVPSTASNGKFDPEDFAPAALYGVSGFFVFIGVF